jgi:hypothetical protein
MVRAINPLNIYVASHYFTAVDPPKATCSFHFYAQLAPSHISESQLIELEEEIQNPSGIWMFMPPTLALDGILVSKDCGILYEIGNTEGVR